MTIFHVLKYPISDPPTIEQLQALPRRVYLKWRKYLNFNRHIEPEDMHVYLIRAQLSSCQQYTKYLRQLIRRLRK